MMCLGHAGTYHTRVSYTQSTQAVSPEPSDVLRCPRPPLCAGDFQAVTILPSPPPSNTNFLTFLGCSFFNPGQCLFMRNIPSPLNLKRLVANTLQSAVHWSSSSASGGAGLPTGTIC